jgi:hypothetical protein
VKASLSGENLPPHPGFFQIEFELFAPQKYIGKIILAAHSRQLIALHPNQLQQELPVRPSTYPKDRINR